MPFNTNTWVRALAAGLYRIIDNGYYAHRLNGVFSGLLPDLIGEGTRLAMRYSMPLQDTPTDGLVHLLRHYGLPAYVESYAATIARLRDAWPTHEVAGAAVMLGAEAIRCGLADAVAIPNPFFLPHLWLIESTEAGATPLWGGFDYGDGTVFGPAIPLTTARNIARMLKYFRPAGARFLGVQPP